jgi:hypothetical protein
MKVRVSIALSSELLTKVDNLAGSKHSRSEIIERVLQLHFQLRSPRAIYGRDLEPINAGAVRLNSKAGDVLTYYHRNIESSAAVSACLSLAVQ